MDRLAQSEARASEAEKQAQQKEADLRRKLEELALAEERAVSAFNNDGDFSRVQASAGEPPQFRADSAAAARFSQLDELRCTALRRIRHHRPWARRRQRLVLARQRRLHPRCSFLPPGTQQASSPTQRSPSPTT